ncbi:hypothetical protein [Craterilacuibacter sp.]|uniref:hypothetical protein n=1 Tax=Craterilacuibacter sp. TaxID=2870909 RepID=UPI003F31DADD
MNKMTRLASLALGTALLSACQTMMAPTVRNNVAAYGTQWFADAGHPLAGPLVCENAGNTNTLLCNGTTVSGKSASMSGVIASQEVAGAPFVGTVNGNRVFTANMP